MQFHRIAALRAVLLVLGTLASSAILAPAVRADDYAWQGPSQDGGNGDFASAEWYDETTMKPNMGPPGGGDGAFIDGDAVVTCSGGSVDRFFTTESGVLSLTGTLSVNTLGSCTLTGSGSLTAGSLGAVTVGDSSDAAQTVSVTGANLTLGSVTAPFFDIEGGGSLVVKSDLYSGSTMVSGAQSSLECDGTLTGFNGTISDGAKVTALALGPYQGMSGQLACSGAGTTVSISGNAVFQGEFLAVDSGASVTVGGNLDLNPKGSIFGSPGSLTVDGPGSSLTVGATLELPAPAQRGEVGSIVIEDGASVEANEIFVDGGTNTGSIFISDGSVAQAAHACIVGYMGTATMQTVGRLTVTGAGSAVAFGFISGGNGAGSFSGNGTVLDTGPAQVALGQEAGSVGNVTLSDSAVMMVGGGGASEAYLHVGDAGYGSLQLLSGAALNVAGASVPMEIGSQARAVGDIHQDDGVGAVTVGAGCTMTLAGPLSVGAMGTGTLNVQGTATLAGSLSVGTLGFGTLNVQGTATVGGNFFLGQGSPGSGSSRPTGVVNVTAGGSLTVGSGLQSLIGIGEGTDAKGSLSVSGSGSFLDLNGATVIGNLGDGLLMMSGGAQAKAIRAAIGGAPGSLGSVSVNDSGTKLTVTDELFLGGLPGQADGTGVITNQSGGLITVENLLDITSTGSVNVSPLLPPPGGTTTSVGGRIFVGTDNFGPDGAIRVGHGGVLAGKGKQAGTTVKVKNVTGNVYIGPGGRFRPGGDPGVFAIDGDCDLSEGGGGETDMEAAGAGTAGTDYDQLMVTGQVTLGGTLRLVLLEGYKPQVGDTLEIVRGKTVTGSFQQVAAPGLTLDTVPASGKLAVKIMSVADVPAPIITSGKTATGKLGKSFSYQIVATGLPAGYAATGLPSGLDIDEATGLMSGTPAAAGDFNVKITATSVGGTGSGSLKLTVKAAAPAVPVIAVSSPLMTATPDMAFSYQIDASNAPTAYAVVNLPAGLTLNAASGLISGTPTLPGTFNIMLSATNANGTGTATLTLTIAARPVATLTATVPSVTAGSGRSGEITVKLTPAPKTQVVVDYAIKGDAINGTDYSMLTGKVKFKAGRASKVIKIMPKGDLEGAAQKTVSLTLKAGKGYKVGTAKPVKVKIVAGK